jgi:hypothetical protein
VKPARSPVTMVEMAVYLTHETRFGPRAGW